MAAMGNAQVIALELERVTPKVRKVFEQDDTFASSIKQKDVEKISNREMRIPLELRPGGSFQYFDADGGDLGRGGGPTYDKAVLQPVFMSENTEYTKLAQWGTDSDRKAVENGVRKLVAGQMDELKRQIESQLMQPGTGVIGTIAAGGVATSGGVDTYTLTSNFGNRLIRFGQVIQVFDTTLATLRGKGTVTALDAALGVNTIQVTPAITGAAATDVIVVNGIANPAAMPALYGVPYHHSNASTGTWLAFNRATTPEIRSNGINASGNALALPQPRLAMNSIGNRIGINHKMSPVAWMHPAQKQQYEEIGQLVSIIQKKPSEERLDMYFDGMQMAGAPVRDSFNWDKSRIDFIVEGVWGWGEILPIGFYKTDGRTIFELRGPSGGVATADIFYMVVGRQAFVNNPAATAYIYGLEIPTGY